MQMILLLKENKEIKWVQTSKNNWFELFLFYFYSILILFLFFPLKVDD